MIKNIPLQANVETKIELQGGIHVNIENFGEGTVYVSKSSGVVPESDGVMTISGGSAKVFRFVATHEIIDATADYYGKIYVLSDSDTKIQIETANDLNFKQVRKGGGAMPNFVKNQIVIGIIENNANTYYFGTYEEV